MAKSFFITGTDTDIGKTIVTAGIARAMKNMKIDVGVMKPFAAGKPQKNGFRSEDVQLLVNAAHVNDSEELINPYFFPIIASPYTASKNLDNEIDVKKVLTQFKKLSQLHDALLVEGIGGIMTPILKDYFIVNFIKELNLDTIIVTSSRIGTVNHTIMTIKLCKNYGIKLRGIIINNFNSNGYSNNELKRDLEELTEIPVIGFLPHIQDSSNLEKISQIISKQIHLPSLL